MRPGNQAKLSFKPCACRGNFFEQIDHNYSFLQALLMQGKHRFWRPAEQSNPSSPAHAGVTSPASSHLIRMYLQSLRVQE